MEMSDELRESELLRLITDILDAANNNDSTLTNVLDLIKEFSVAAGMILGDIQREWLNSQDRHCEGIRSVKSWCTITLAILEIYTSNYGPESKNDLLDSLKYGEEMLEQFIAALEACQKNLNLVSGHLARLEFQLKNDFDTRSEYYNKQITKLRYATSAAGGSIGGGLVLAAGAKSMATCIAGPMGFAVTVATTSIAGAFTAKRAFETLVKPKFDAHISQIQRNFGLLRLKIEEASLKVADKMKQLKDDLNAAHGTRTNCTTLKTIITLQSQASTQSTTLRQIQQLKTRCGAFVERGFAS